MVSGTWPKQVYNWRPYLSPSVDKSQDSSMEEEQETLVTISNHKPKSKSNYRIIDALESKSFSWIFIDQSNPWKAALSWLIFFIFTVGLPMLSHIVYQCSTCDDSHQRPFDMIVQLSLSICSTLSFINLSSFARKYGLRRFLFLDKLSDVSAKVRDGYSEQLHVRSLIPLFINSKLDRFS